MVGEELEPNIELGMRRRPSDALGTLPVYAAVTYEQLEAMATQETAQLLFELLREHPTMEARPEQAECLDALQATRDAGINRALVHMATGTGKTTVVAVDAKRFKDQHPNARILWLSHQNDINDQARKRFESIWGPQYKFGNFTGEGEKDYHEVDCLFASFQVMRDWKDAFHPDEFDYIVVDESHHAKANTYEPTLRYFQPKFLLGVTGTPDRHDLRDIREIFGQEVYKLPLEEAIARGLLANVDYRVITDDIQDLQKLRDAYGNKLSFRQLNRTIFAPKRDEEIIRIIKEHAAEIEGKPRTIIFCESVEYTEHLAVLMGGAEPLHSKMVPWMQDRAIDMFRRGEIETLVVVDMFNEGLDIPEANQIVFARSTQSKTIFLQQLGRGLRKTPYKQSVQVLDLVANCDRLAMLDEFWKEINSYGNEWGPLDKPDNITIDVGGIDFNESAREILELLQEIDARNSLYTTWTPDDSITYYTALSAELKQPARVSDIIERSDDHKGPPIAILLRGFDGKLAKLKEACGLDQSPPTGWLSVAEFSRLHSSSASKVRQLANELGIELPFYSFYNHSADALSPEAQAQILNTPHFTDLPPEGVVSVNAFAAQVGVRDKTMHRLVDQLGFKLKTYRFGTLRTGGLTPEDQALLLAQPAVKLVPASEDEVSTRQLRENLNVGQRTIDKAVKALKIEPRTKKFGPKPGQALTLDEAQAVKEYIDTHRLPDAPEDAMSLPVFAKSLGIAPQTIAKVVARRGIELPVCRFGAQEAPAVLPEHWDAIFADESLNVPLPPQGAHTMSGFSEQTGIHFDRVKRAVRILGLQLTPARLKNGVFPVLTLEQQAQVIEFLQRE